METASSSSFLAEAALFLAAAAVAAPLARWLRIGSVLGYLGAGVLIGPQGFGAAVYNPSLLHFAEFGVVLLLFVIGLELRPKRLRAMRISVFGYGTAQVVITSGLIMAAALGFGRPAGEALLIGLALSLSSTAFALQVLEERGEVTARHGRLAFGILLAQDLAAIPMLALAPMLGSVAVAEGFDPWHAGKAVLTILGVVLAGRFLLGRLYRLVASTNVREAMTASALLTVVAVALLMEAVGLPPSLGAFLAGGLLAESEYRHQVEADIEPFKGLLLGLFFTAIGMSLDLRLLIAQWPLVLALVAGVVLVKGLVLYGLGRHAGLAPAGAQSLALAISQGGEFAFALFATALGVGAVSSQSAAMLTVVVTLSMAATPLLLAVADLLRRAAPTMVPLYDTPKAEPGHVIIAGFGRFSQIVARILRARGVPFTALDISSEQVDFVRRFGSSIYYGDAARLDILRAAEAHKARAFVLAIDDVEASLPAAEVVRQHFPELRVLARARNRQHAYRLLDLKIEVIRRETYLSAIDLARELLRSLGATETEARRLVETFRDFDERRLRGDYADASDQEKLAARARSATEELERLFNEDQRREQAVASTAARKPS